MRQLLISLLLCLASARTLAATWSDLWFTPEQRAQQLLDRHPDQAARLFSDPRRRAYAEARAGHYPQAAQLLKPFRDASSQYNRGNALARSGQLEEALAAYDAALKQAPADADIKHNRDLVAQALEQQKRNPGQQGGGPEGKGKQHSAGQGNDPGAPSQGRPQGSHGKEAQTPQPGGSAPSRTTQADQQPQGKQPSQAASAGQPNRGGSQGAQSSASRAGQQPGAAGQGAAASVSAAQDPQQAQRDAAAGTEYLGRQSGASASSNSAEHMRQLRSGDLRAKSEASSDRQEPPSEQTLALDQWLRRIPEDPGELLRRKFLIEHMMRQQQGSPW
jgi:Ca-activated chloride channel family protein